eukprot:87259-Pyramimonas_sp.AAC.1
MCIRDRFDDDTPRSVRAARRAAALSPASVIASAVCAKLKVGQSREKRKSPCPYGRVVGSPRWAAG